MSTLAPVSGQTDSDNYLVDVTEYLTIVGGINYLATMSRPDLLYPMSIVAQRCAAPRRDDMRLLQRMLRYIATTRDSGLEFSKGEVRLTGSVDASHNCYDDGKGHFGYSFSLGPSDGAFFASSKKLKLVTLSSTESEYVALCEATRDAIWLRRLLAELGFPQLEPTIMYQDNESTIAFVAGHRNHKATKHINPKFHFTGEAVEQGEICLVHMASELMVADVLTKALPADGHRRLASSLLHCALPSPESE